ncbi:Sad1 UNC domain containing protein [Trichuris trichiura]|uniref:Sad1 UNC domain containing protein n=1 Tax=Trichuris trichiura TaxID=36087 RepID=A0A077Z2L4_TRITR|nr:Sad1 UNC domain containing protein [Trichuris trichiura]
MATASDPEGVCSLAEHLHFLHLFFPVDSTADVGKCPSDKQKEAELPIVESQKETLELTDDEPLQSFDEWTRRKLEEQRLVATVADTVVNGNGAPAAAAPIAARNYASKDCGARIVMANAEARKPSALLNGKRKAFSHSFSAYVIFVLIVVDKDNDEYMLNPCKTDGPKWFIIELCETVQISCVEMANFELFSSSPKEFRLVTSERYPSSEWHLLGEWTAADSRQIQRYMVASKLYAKYVKVELLSHYGSEHFCPLSLVRVLGISMVEEYEAEAMKHESFASPIREQSGATLSDSDEQKSSAKGYLLNTARDTVKSIAESVLKKASFVFKVIKTTTEQQQRYAANGGATFAHPSTNGDAVSSSSYWSCLLSPKNQSKRFTSRHCYFTQLMENRFVTPAGSSIALDSVNSGRSSTADTSSFAGKRRFAKCGNTSLHGHCSSEKNELQKHLTMNNEQPKWCPLKGNLTRSKFKRRRLIPTVGYPQRLNSSNDASFNAKKGTISSNGGATVASASSLHLLPGSTTSAKESVFIRLNNRIKKLEINVSLSSQYLSELSRTYKRQMEEMQKNWKRTLSLVAETKRHLLSMIEVHNDLLHSLTSRVDEVSSMVTTAEKISVPLPDKWWQWHPGLLFMEFCLVSCIVLFTVLGSKSTSRLRRSDVAKVVMDILMSEMSVLTQPSYLQNSDEVRRVDVRPSPSSVASNKSSRALTNVNGKWKVFLLLRSSRTLRRTDASMRKASEPQRLRCFSGQRRNANSLADPKDSPSSSSKVCCRSCPGVLFSSVPRTPPKNEISKWIEHPAMRAPLKKGYDRETPISPGFLCHTKATNRPSPSPRG